MYNSLNRWASDFSDLLWFRANKQYPFTINPELIIKDGSAMVVIDGYIRTLEDIGLAQKRLKNFKGIKDDASSLSQLNYMIDVGFILSMDYLIKISVTQDPSKPSNEKAKAKQLGRLYTEYAPQLARKRNALFGYLYAIEEKNV